MNFRTRRILLGIAGIAVTLWAVLTLTFILTFAVPTDPARAVVGPKGTPEQIDQVRESLRLDDPIVVQYGRYLTSTARGDLGYSYSQRQTVTSILSERLPYTVLLATAAVAIQLVVGGTIGMLSAVRAGGLVDRVGLVGSLLVISLPSFWVGLMLLYVFGFKLAWLPLGGSDLPWALVLPAATLGLSGAAWTSRIMRATAYEVLHSDVVRGLRAQGIRPRAIVVRHVGRMAAGPVLTMLALDLGLLLGGAVLVESVFSWPGLGLTAYQALKQNDVPLLMGCVVVGSAFVIAMNLIADLARAALDPRTTR